MCMQVQCSLLLHYFIGINFENLRILVSSSAEVHYASGSKYKAIDN